MPPGPWRSSPLGALFFFFFFFGPSWEYFVTIATYKVRKYQRDTSEVATGGVADMLLLVGMQVVLGSGLGLKPTMERWPLPLLLESTSGLLGPGVVLGLALALALALGVRFAHCNDCTYT
eukprot:FR739767.1.p2 GENE.FR739767.1~~FR739767.1.p2  ORF type:complete len:120 (-),score=31.08 FR739767.1:628-987(-)